MASPIQLDRSPSGIVIHCTLCPWWSAFRFTQGGAEDCACEHEERSHPDLRHRRVAREVRASKARHAGSPKK